jgi:hypothetical protein
MSCILLHPSHHAALAGAWFAYSRDRHLSPTIPHRFEYGKNCPTEGDVARILAAENGRAYADRYEYQDRESKRIAGAHDAAALISDREAQQMRYRITDGKIAPAQVLKWLHSYDYQTSDSTTYAGSLAEWIVGQIEKAAGRCLPGYDEATWTCEGFTPARTTPRGEGDTTHACQDA